MVAQAISFDFVNAAAVPSSKGRKGKVSNA